MKKEDLKELYLKWTKAEEKSAELTKAILSLEKVAKKYTNADIAVVSSMFEGVSIIWENYNIWGLNIFYSPKDFINACKNKG